MTQPRRIGAVFATVLMLITAGGAAAQTVKIATIAPADSPWHDALLRIARDWQRISDGSIRVTVYPGGIAGSEPDMIRKMRIGQLHAGALTVLGLKELVPDVLALSSPFLVRNNGEMRYLLESMTPYYREQFRRKGFRLIGLTMAGWARVYARDPVISPEDLRKQTFTFVDSNADMIHAWQNMGFRVVTLPLNEILTSLQSGMVDALLATPLLAAAYQWFGIARHMTDLPAAPVVAGMVVSERTWQQLPEDLRPALATAAMDSQEQMYRETLAVDEEALALMQDYGLEVHPVPGRAETAWRKLAEAGLEAVIGRIFSRESYERVEGVLLQYRREHGE